MTPQQITRSPRPVPGARLTPSSPTPNPDWFKPAQHQFDTAVQRANKRWWIRLRAFIRGHRELGLGLLTAISNIGLLFPVTKPYVTGLQLLQAVLNRRQVDPTNQLKSNTMIEKIKQFLAQSSTKAGLLVLVAILAHFGIDISPDLLSESLVGIIDAVAIVLAHIGALWAIFHNEDQRAQDKDNAV